MARYSHASLLLVALSFAGLCGQAFAQCSSTGSASCPYFSCNSTTGVAGQINTTTTALIGRFFNDMAGKSITTDQQCVSFCQLYFPTCAYWTHVEFTNPTDPAKQGECIMFTSSGCADQFAYAPTATCDPSSDSNKADVSTSGMICAKQPPAPSPAPPSSPAGVQGDPHYTGADGSHFDFTGEPGKSYCMISDAHLHLNVFHGGRYGAWGSNPHKALTWIRNVGVMWGHHTVQLAARAGATWQYENGYMAVMTVDGEEVTLGRAGDSLSLLNGKLGLKWIAARQPSGDDEIDVYEMEIEGVMRMLIKLRPEIANLRTLEDGVVHFSLEIQRLSASPNVHGVLGQTFRIDHQDRLSSQHLEHSDLLNVDMVQGDNAEGFLDGRPRDYETSSLLSADCKFGRFARAHTVDVDTARAIEISSGSVVTPYSIVSPNRVRANL